MNAYTELRERRHALLFTIEQGCRRQGIRHWDDIQRYLQAAASTPQGRRLLIDATDVECYIRTRRGTIAHKQQSAASRTADRILAARDQQAADAFTRFIDNLPSAESVTR